jgi:disulfide bond formation protein DsbB
VTDTVVLAFSVLAVLVQTGLALLVLVALASLASPRARRVLDETRRTVAGGELHAAAVVALVATSGRLYFSEVAGFLPCVLCWWQRVFMYPLVVLLGVGALDRGLRAASRRRFSAYVLPLPLLGAAFALYHLYVEHVPGAESVLCSVGVPCSVRWFTELGYITLPMLALTAFAAIAALLVLSLTRPEPAGTAESSH